MSIKRRGYARWSGDTFKGSGAISTASGALQDQPYGFTSRFGDVPGSNPEELLAAAHAACFTMALTVTLGGAQFVAQSLETSAEVKLEQIDGGYVITAVHLTVNGCVEDCDAMTFDYLANEAKANCPVSKALNAKITLDTKLLD